MKIFALFFMLGYGLVVGAFKIISGIARLAWLMVMLLSRVVSERPAIPLLKGGEHRKLRSRISVFEDWSLAKSRVPESG